MRVCREVNVSGLERGSLQAFVSKPTIVAEALLSRQRSALQVYTFALCTTIRVRVTLILVLTERTIVEVIALAATVEGFSISRACLLETLSLLDIYVGARPESVRSRPFIRLTQQAKRAVVACEVGRQLHWV